MSRSFDVSQAAAAASAQALARVGLDRRFGALRWLGGAGKLAAIGLRQAAAPSWSAEDFPPLSGLTAFLPALRDRLRLLRRAGLPAVLAAEVLQFGFCLAPSHLDVTVVPAGAAPVRGMASAGVSSGQGAAGEGRPR